jgi:hypothetical protein
MLDCEIYGLNPLGHHITNLLIHIIDTLLLFFLLSRMTNTVWRSAFVAAAFALHPIHVESVTWVAERKDVLSGLFWMLTIIAYVHYTKHANIKRYMLVLLLFVMGLMSKPMVVTLPFVLLLLDWWPMNRYRKAPARQLIAEKVPLFVLSATTSVITFAAQKLTETVWSIKVWPLPTRLINALECYFNYIMKMFYPKGLAVLYPITNKPTIDAAVLAVVGIIVLLRVLGRGRPWLVVGLLWYLGTLVPVIGLVQVGIQIMADRYTYLPSIGVFIIIAWAARGNLLKDTFFQGIPGVGGNHCTNYYGAIDKIRWATGRTSLRCISGPLPSPRTTSLYTTTMACIFASRGNTKKQFGTLGKLPIFIPSVCLRSSGFV